MCCPVKGFRQSVASWSSDFVHDLDKNFIFQELGFVVGAFGKTKHL